MRQKSPFCPTNSIRCKRRIRKRLLVCSTGHVFMLICDLQVLMFARLEDQVPSCARRGADQLRLVRTCHAGNLNFSPTSTQMSLPVLIAHIFHAFHARPIERATRLFILFCRARRRRDGRSRRRPQSHNFRAPPDRRARRAAGARRRSDARYQTRHKSPCCSAQPDRHARLEAGARQLLSWADGSTRSSRSSSSTTAR
jgi:hypothetical protein